MQQSLACHILINVSTFIDFSWVEGELCEVNVILENPLPIELKVSSMVSFHRSNTVH